MKHYLEAFFTLSGPLPEESKDDLKNFFTQFIEKIQESRKDGEFKIDKWNIKDNQLNLTISSIDSPMWGSERCIKLNILSERE